MQNIIRWHSDWLVLDPCSLSIVMDALAEKTLKMFINLVIFQGC